MKKNKIGFYACIMLFIVMTTIMVTGCGNGNVKKEENSNHTETESSEEKETIEIKEINAISEEYAVVTSVDNTTYIIDKNGNAQGTISLDDGYALINKNGYVIVKTSYDNQIIYDKTGKELLTSSDEVQYEFGISDSNLLIRKTNDSSPSDTTSKTEVIDVDGNIQYEITDEDIASSSYEYVGENWFAATYSNGIVTTVEFLYDIDTQEKIEQVQHNLNGDYVIDEVYADIFSSDYTEWKYKIRSKNDHVLELTTSYELNKNGQIFYKDTGDEVLNDYYYDDSEQGIFDQSGNKVRDLSDNQGATWIGYYDDNYYVFSSTGYYYALDSDFNSILEPVSTHIYNINYYGVMARDEDNTYTILYDHELNNEKVLTYKLKRDPYFFIAEIEDSSDYFNLNTEEKLVIYQ